MGVFRGPKRPLCSYRQRHCLSVIVKYRSGLEILIFPRRKAPFFTRLRACGSFQEHAPHCYWSRHAHARGVGYTAPLAAISGRPVVERPVVLPPERLKELMACFPIKVSASRLASALQNVPLWRRQRTQQEALPLSWRKVDWSQDRRQARPNSRGAATPMVRLSNEPQCGR
jgi:hypothetical protein